jgi:hypothetical protein
MNPLWWLPDLWVHWSIPGLWNPVMRASQPIDWLATAECSAAVLWIMVAVAIAGAAVSRRQVRVNKIKRSSVTRTG